MRCLVLSIFVFFVSGCSFDGKDGRDGRDGLLCNYQADDAGVLWRCENGQEFRIEDGKIGPRGAKGDRGEPGPQGKPGPKGDKGDPGEDGENGRDGVDGQDGRDGQDGESGASFYKHLDCHGEWSANAGRRHLFKVDYAEMSSGDSFMTLTVEFGLPGSPNYSNTAGAYFPKGFSAAISDGHFKAMYKGDYVEVEKLATSDKLRLDCEVVNVD